MKGSIDSYKGTLVEFCAKYDDGFQLTIHPLESNVAIIVLNREAEGEIDIADGQEASGSIIAIDHDGKIVGSYNPSGSLQAIEHAVLYPDGRFWIGPVLEGEEGSADYMILTVAALDLLKDRRDFSFRDDSQELRPTVLVKTGDTVQPKCGSHGCGRICHAWNKFVVNDVES